MKLNIKLDCRKSGQTPQGFPIVVHFAANYKQRDWRTGHYAKKKEWNERMATPTSKHPEYYLLLDYLSSLKLAISDIILQTKNRPISMNEVKVHLFKKEIKIFNNAAMESFEKGYKGTVWSAVRSFNKFAPNLLFSEITNELAIKYRDHLLKKGNKPGGVDSYMRSLRAIWNRLSKEPSPFSGVPVEIPETIKTVANNLDLAKLKLFQENGLYNIKKTDHNNQEKTFTIKASKSIGTGGYINYTNYWLLMFYLGGIDPEALSKLRYDKNVVGKRIVFNRDKGRSKMSCNNSIPKEAWEILKLYDCKPYLVPIYKNKNYHSFSTNFSERMRLLSNRIELSVELRPKSARYTFINKAQQLLIDERITSQIVGHKRRTTTSIYTNDFPQSVQDEAHLKIINTY